VSAIKLDIVKNKKHFIKFGFGTYGFVSAKNIKTSFLKKFYSKHAVLKDNLWRSLRRIGEIYELEKPFLLFIKLGECFYFSEMLKDISRLLKIAKLEPAYFYFPKKKRMPLIIPLLNEANALECYLIVDYADISSKKLEEKY